MHRAEFIALDTETSGLDPSRDQVLEVAAVRFVDGEPQEQFESLIHFKGHLPLRVERLTGITKEMLETAPPAAEVLPKLQEFVGNRLVVGHNIAFDLEFLNKQFRKLSMPPAPWNTQDTLIFSSLLLPTLPSHKLGLVAKAMNLPPDAQHRALGDAITAGKVWVTALKGLGEIPSSLRALLASLLDHQGFGKYIGKPEEENLKFTQPSILMSTAIQLRPWPVVAQPDKTEKPVANLNSLWGPNGKLAQKVEDYEDRPQQVQMAQEVEKTLERGGLLAVEAGTGVGKSFAYLFPATIFASTQNKRVIVSTHTRGLQDQLFNKDWPLVEEVLGTDFPVHAIKGKGNYLCMEKLTAALDKASPDKALALALLCAYAYHSEDGDLENFLPWAQMNVKGMKDLLKDVALEEHHPCRRTCRNKPRCFLALRDEKLAKSKLLIVNHALLFALAVSEKNGENLLDDAALIMDEAHHLEDVATQSLGAELSLFSLQLFARTIDPTQSLSLPQRLPAGLIDSGDGRVRFGELLAGHTHFRECTQKLQNSLLRLQQQEVPVFQAVKSLWWDLPEKYRERVMASLDDLLDSLNAIHRCVGTWRLILENEVKEGVQDSFLDSLVLLCEQVQKQAENLMAFMKDWQELRPKDSSLGWIEVTQGTTGPSWRLVRSPVSVADLLPMVFGHAQSLVFTSATLALSGGFGFFLDRTGLGNLEERDPKALTLQSPFDFENNLQLIVPRSVHGRGGAQVHHELEKQIADQIVTMTRRLGGGMMVLFNSIRELKNVAKLARPELEKDRRLLLAQFVDGTRQAITQEFRDEPGSVLFGTRSFFEGMDFKGDTLRILVLIKLPFPYLKEPVIEGRMRALQEAGRDAQRSYYQPLAMFLFRQAVGRVIRSSTDRGLVFLLDERIVQKSYGLDFLKNIPNCPLIQGTFEETLDHAERFFQPRTLENSEEG